MKTVRPPYNLGNKFAVRPPQTRRKLYVTIQQLGKLTISHDQDADTLYSVAYGLRCRPNFDYIAPRPFNIAKSNASALNTFYPLMVFDITDEYVWLLTTNSG